MISRSIPAGPVRKTSKANLVTGKGQGGSGEGQATCYAPNPADHALGRGKPGLEERANSMRAADPTVQSNRCSIL